MSETRQKFNFFTMFRDGFKSMTIGKTLWTIVIIKLIIMFFVLRPIYFKNFLNTNFDTEEARSEHVSKELIHNLED